MIRFTRENSVFSDELVRSCSIRWWSLILCMISPVILVSKKLIGSFISLIKKSDMMEIFILADKWRRIQLRITSIPILPRNSMIWASKTM